MSAKRTIPRVCEMCGAAFLGYAHRVRRGLNRFCSKTCGGKYNGMNKEKRTIEERFWAKVNKDAPPPSHRPELGACWLWTAGQFRYEDGFNYGAFRKDGRNQPAHKVALEMQLGRPLGEGMKALHRCDTPLCVRNDGGQSHLFEGTQTDNMRDMVAKGRDRWHINHTIASEIQNQNQTAMSLR